MIWLAQQMWLWLVLSALTGAALTTAMSLKKVTVERWVEQPGGAGREPRRRWRRRPPRRRGPRTRRRTRRHADGEPFGAPFPEYRGAAMTPSPWEQQERWSKPARVSPSHGGSPADEWSEAATSWRDWASEATGKPPRAKAGEPGPTRRQAGPGRGRAGRGPTTGTCSPPTARPTAPPSHDDRGLRAGGRRRRSRRRDGAMPTRSPTTGRRSRWTWTVRAGQGDPFPGYQPPGPLDADDLEALRIAAEKREQETPRAGRGGAPPARGRADRVGARGAGTPGARGG